MISVIIPTRNAEFTLAEQLEALSCQQVDGPWEVVIANHGSTDASADVARSWSDRLPIRIVDVPTGGGASRSRNGGLLAATGEYLLFCDADDVVAPGWITAMVQALQHADIAGGSRRPFAMSSSAYIWNGRKPGADTLEGLLGGGRYASATGCNIGVRAEVTQSILFPEDYTDFGGEELAFCWRAQEQGFRLVAAPDAIVNYRYRDSLRSTMRQHYWWGYSFPRLLHDFPDIAMRRSWKGVLWSWFVAGRRLVRSRNRDEVGAVLVLGSALVGRIVGSARYRVWGL